MTDDSRPGAGSDVAPGAAPARVVVVGGTGFVGRAVIQALRNSGVEAVALSAPRLTASDEQLDRLSEGSRSVPGNLVASMRDAVAVINCAGNPDASSTEVRLLLGANALLPAVLYRAAVEAGVSRFVHVSSAVVQGNAPMLDETPQRRPFSPYARSKARGEEALEVVAEGACELVIYRPPSVHAPDRRVTRGVARLAGSPLSTVAGGPDRPAPHALLDNVAAAVAHLARCAGPPRYVNHPSEGVTTGSLLTVLGHGRAPLVVPERLARLALGTGKLLLGRSPRMSAHLRRVEMLWFGQAQAPSWLERSGWRRPVGLEGWDRIAAELGGGNGSARIPGQRPAPETDQLVTERPHNDRGETP